MRLTTAICILLYTLVAAGAYAAWQYDLVAKCVEGEACFREWLSATSGWAAVLAAIPTILYLSVQIRDADRHQRTDFAIQLRKHRILATRTLQIANTAIMMIEVSQTEAGDGREDVRLWDPETVDGLLHHLRDSTLGSFESEIEYPVGFGAWGTAMVLERAMNGDAKALISAPQLVRQFFERLANQAQNYLDEIKEIVG